MKIDCFARYYFILEASNYYIFLFEVIGALLYILLEFILVTEFK